MDWIEVKDGVAGRFVLEDGTSVVALIKSVNDEHRLAFYTDVGDFDRTELEADKLGELSDLIDSLRPGDIICICCSMDKISKTC